MIVVYRDRRNAEQRLDIGNERMGCRHRIGDAELWEIEGGCDPTTIDCRPGGDTTIKMRSNDE